MERDPLPGQREECPACLNQVNGACYIEAIRGKQADALLGASNNGGGCLSFEPDFMLQLINRTRRGIMRFTGSGNSRRKSSSNSDEAEIIASEIQIGSSKNGEIKFTQSDR